MIKKLSMFIVIIIAIPLVAALFVHKSYHVEREILIEKPKDEIFNYVKYLKNQNKFSKWANIDPNMISTFRGTDGEVGFVSAWESQHEQVGTGEQEIIAIDEGKRIDFELRFFKPFEATDPAYMIIEEVSPTQTKVKWGFSGHMDYPTNLLFLLMDFEKTIGDDLQMGLDNLKQLQEQ